jgi:hypothetical protein
MFRRFSTALCSLVLGAFWHPCLFGDEPRVPIVVDIAQLTETTVPTHMDGKGAVFTTGNPARAIVVKKLKINKQSQPDDRTVTLTVDLTGTECGKPFSGPAVVTYCLSNQGQWQVCKIDCTAATYYVRKK